MFLQFQGFQVIISSEKREQRKKKREQRKKKREKRRAGRRKKPSDVFVVANGS